MSKIGKNFIAGSSHFGHTNVENINSSDIGDVIGHSVQAHLGQFDTALDAARSAQKKWTSTGHKTRQTILMTIGNELRARRVALGTLLSGEEGKPFAEGVGKVFQAGQFFAYHAAGNPE